MLYILHFDKNESEVENYFDEEMRIDLGKFPDANTHVRLRMVGWNTNSLDGDLHLSFPDLQPNYFNEEFIDAANEHEVRGMLFSNTEGSLWGITSSKDANDVINNNNTGWGAFGKSSENRYVDLHLGRLDSQKDYFRVIVNARRARPNQSVGNQLNNVSVLLEVHHGSVIG